MTNHTLETTLEDNRPVTTLGNAYDILLQIATFTVDRGQLTQYLGFFEKIKIKIKKILKQV